MRRAKCASCGAVIIWARTQKGKAQPIDADPTPDGNVALDIIGGKPHVRVLSGGLLDGFEVEPDEPRYMPHHATCPHAKEWRR